MQNHEASAATRQEAIQIALDRLGIELHEADEIEILDEGSRGFLGFGARMVRVRVTAEHLPDLPPEAPANAAPVDVVSDDAEVLREGAADKRPPHNTRSNRRPRRERSDERPRGERAPERAARPRPTKEPKRVSEDVDVEGRGREAAALLSAIIDKMGMQNTVGCEATEDGNIRLLVESEDSAILIGRKGRNLNALQYIVNRIMARADDADGSERVLVDVEGYQDRRNESLQDMALSLAQRAKDSGRSMRMKPLNPQERRIIHLALQDDEEIRTFSLGDSLYRTIVIAPRDGEQESRSSRGRRGGRGGNGGNRGRGGHGGGNGRSRRGGGPERSSERSESGAIEES